jgi:hypothetical protein
MSAYGRIEVDDEGTDRNREWLDDPEDGSLMGLLRWRCAIVLGQLSDHLAAVLVDAYTQLTIRELCGAGC